MSSREIECKRVGRGGREEERRRDIECLFEKEIKGERGIERKRERRRKRERGERKREGR